MWGTKKKVTKIVEELDKLGYEVIVHKPSDIRPVRQEDMADLLITFPEVSTPLINFAPESQELLRELTKALRGIQFELQLTIDRLTPSSS